MGKVYFEHKSNESRERMRISRKKIMIAILDERIYERNVGKCQDRLSQSLAWTPRSSQMMQDPLALILISHEAQILVIENCDFCYDRSRYT